MQVENGNIAKPDCAGLGRTLDRLLLDEANHRVANEVASALAALRLAQSAKGQRARREMMGMAIGRLQGFGDCSRLFAAVTAAPTDAGSLVERVCQAMLMSRAGAKPQSITLDVVPIIIDGEIARRIAMIAYELITNSLKYAFEGPGRRLEVQLSIRSGFVVLVVRDQGPGSELGSTTRSDHVKLGSRIVKDLVSASSGSLEIETGQHGTRVEVMLPVGPMQ